MNLSQITSNTTNQTQIKTNVYMLVNKTIPTDEQLSNFTIGNIYFNLVQNYFTMYADFELLFSQNVTNAAYVNFVGNELFCECIQQLQRVGLSSELNSFNFKYENRETNQTTGTNTSADTGNTTQAVGYGGYTATNQNGQFQKNVNTLNTTTTDTVRHDHTHTVSKADPYAAVYWFKQEITDIINTKIQSWVTKYCVTIY